MCEQRFFCFAIAALPRRVVRRPVTKACANDSTLLRNLGVALAAAPTPCCIGLPAAPGVIRLTMQQSRGVATDPRFSATVASPWPLPPHWPSNGPKSDPADPAAKQGCRSNPAPHYCNVPGVAVMALPSHVCGPPHLCRPVLEVRCCP